MIISRTPVRLSFFGGGTDYREYYERQGGAVLGATINKYVYVSLNRLSRFFDYKIRVGYSKAELVNSVDEIIHPSVRECLRFKKVDGNLDIHIFADLPARTGLGSSSSFTVGFLHALYALDDRIVSSEQLAKDAHHVEQVMLKENVGSQDQVHAAFGGFNLIEFDPSGFRVKPLIISKRKQDILEKSLMVLFTGQTRFANDIAKEQVDRTKSRENDRYLQRMHDMVSESVAIIANCAEETFLQDLGTLMNECWELKKSLSSKVSNTLIDDAYCRARKVGAHGGKISGAGGGGFLTLLVDPDKQEAVRRELKDFLQIDLRFEDQGSTIIYLKP